MATYVVLSHSQARNGVAQSLSHLCTILMGVVLTLATLERSFDHSTKSNIVFWLIALQIMGEHGI